MKAEEAQVTGDVLASLQEHTGVAILRSWIPLEENGPREIVDCCLVPIAIRSKGSGGSKLRIPWTFICPHHVGLLNLNLVQCKVSASTSHVQS